MDETMLVNRAQAGEIDGFNGLVLMYQDTAYHLALRLLSDEESAEDAVQTALLSAYRYLHSFRGGSFKAWLLRMVVNACYDEMRRRKRRQFLPLEPVDDDGEPVESPDWMADDADSPEIQAERSEINQTLLACLRELPDEFRTAVALIDLCGLNYEEAAQVTGIPMGTVKSRLARGRSRIRGKLRQRMPELFESVRDASIGARAYHRPAASPVRYLNAI